MEWLRDHKGLVVVILVIVAIVASVFLFQSEEESGDGTTTDTTTQTDTDATGDQSTTTSPDDQTDPVTTPSDQDQVGQDQDPADSEDPVTVAPGQEDEQTQDEDEDESDEFVLPDNWEDLTWQEQIYLNPGDCDLAGGTEVMWPDGSCHPVPDQVDQGETQTGVLPDNWETLDVNQRVALNPFGCDLVNGIMYADGTCSVAGEQTDQPGTDTDDETGTVVNTYPKTATDENFSFTVTGQPTCQTTTDGRTCTVNFTYRNETNATIILGDGGLISDATKATDSRGTQLSPQASGNTETVNIGPGASQSASVVFEVEAERTLLRVSFMDQGDCGTVDTQTDAFSCQDADTTPAYIIL